MSPEWRGHPMSIRQVVRLPHDTMLRLHSILGLMTEYHGTVTSRLVKDDQIVLTFQIPIPPDSSIQIIEPSGQAHDEVFGPQVLGLTWELNQQVPKESPAKL